MSFRPTACAQCGKPLPVPKTVGRPKRYCDDVCRYRGRHTRAQAAAVLPEVVPQDRGELVGALALLVNPKAEPAAPEDQLAGALINLTAIEHGLRRIVPDLPPRLAGPAGKLAAGIGRELRRAYPEVIQT